MRSLIRLWRSDSPALVMIGRIGVSGIGVLSALAIARAVGPDGRGETAAAIAAFYLIPILIAFGVPLEVRRLAARGQSRLRPAIARFIVVSAVPALAIAYALYATLFEGLDGERARWSATIGVAGAPLTVSWMCHASIVFAQRRFRAFVAIQLAQPTLFLGILMVAWATGVASVASVLAANVAGTGLTAVVATVLAREAELDLVCRLPELVTGGFKFAGAAIAEAASNRLDQVLVLPLIGAYQAGLYSVAVTISSVPVALGHALGAAYFTPVALSESVGRQGLKAQAFKSSLILGFGCAAVIALITPLLVSAVFGAEFSAAIAVTWISVAGGVPMISAYVMAQTLAAEGRGVRMTVAQLIAVGVAVVLLILLGPAYGARGAAVASSISYILLLGLLLIMSALPVKSLIPRPQDIRPALRVLLRGAG